MSNRICNPINIANSILNVNIFLPNFAKECSFFIDSKFHKHKTVLDCKENCPDVFFLSDFIRYATHNLNIQLVVAKCFIVAIAQDIVANDL